MPATLLRVATAGEVDDGKSTLIGRLLHDCQAILDDQLAAVRTASARRGSELDLALVTDGLRDERDQGITIDVAYRYFATPRRAFVLADTPGHLQYTRNMVTGASTADAAVVLVDVRHGLTEQSRRHAAVTALLRVPHLVLAVNKIDLVGYRRAEFARVAAAFRAYAAGLGFADVVAIPVSALHGDNVVTRSERTPWYTGPALLEHLESLQTADLGQRTALRLPVQSVVRDPRRDFRGYAGRVVGGVARAGAPVAVLPHGGRSRLSWVGCADGELTEAPPGTSVVVRLAEELDVGRGALLADPADPPVLTRAVVATVCWLAETPGRAGDRVLVRSATGSVPARITAVRGALAVTTGAWQRADELALNDLGGLGVELSEVVPFDRYRDNRHTGAFLLLDPADGDTLAAGMVEEARPVEAGCGPRAAGPVGPVG